MRRVLRDNELSIAMFALFLVFLVAQSIVGYRTTSQLRVWSAPGGREAAAMLERYMSRDSHSRKELWHD
jgi:hypothetical protein